MANDTRERIIHAAIPLLWEHSYQGTSVDILCESANVKKGSFYHFFSSKVDLAIAVIETSWEYTQQSVFIPIFENDNDGIEQLQTLIDKVAEVQFTMHKSSGACLGCAFANLGQEMATKDEHIREAIQVVFNGHCKYISKALQRIQLKDSALSVKLDEKAISIFALFEGAILLAKVANDPNVFRTAASSIKQIALS